MRVVAIGAHPDDVEYGCGGTLAVHAHRGDSVTIVTVSDGARGGDAGHRRTEQRASAFLIGADVHMLNRPDGEFGEFVEFVADIESVVRSTQPDLVYTHLADDLHQDHLCVKQAVKIACRSVANLVFFESPLSSASTAGLYSDITGTLTTKIAMVAAHASQVSKRRELDERTITARARLHGSMIDVDAAELFVVERLRLFSLLAAPVS